MRTGAPLARGTGMARRLVLPVLPVLLALAGTAAAQPVGRPAPVPASVPETRSYAWQILLADAGIIGGTIVLANTAVDDGAGAFLIGGYLLSAPVIHTLHGHPSRAATSLALRAVLPVAGAYLFANDCHEDPDSLDFHCLGAAAIGVLAGAGTAEIVDVIRAKDILPVATIAPSVGSDGRGGWTAGLQGTF
jgi:hypothetical protein